MKEIEISEPQVIGRQGLARWYGISVPMADLMIEQNLVPHIRISEKIVVIPVRALQAYEDQMGRLLANNQDNGEQKDEGN